MRHLISSLQNHNLQLKGDVQRYKRKLRETQMEINKVHELIQTLTFDSWVCFGQTVVASLSQSCEPDFSGTP